MNTEIEINKVKTKEYYTSRGEKLLLTDYSEGEEAMSFYKWNKEVLKVADKIKLGCYFNRPRRLEDDTEPYINPAVMRRVERCRTDPRRYGEVDRHDQTQFESYKKDRKHWEAGCGEAINLIMDCVCMKIKTKIEGLQDYNQLTRTNVMRIMIYLEHLFGGFSADRKQVMHDRMYNFPQIQNVKSLDDFIVMVNDYQLERKTWNRPGEECFEYRNKEMVQLIINKLLKWNRMDDCVRRIKRDRNTLTWSECIEMIEDECQEIKADSRAILFQEQRDNDHNMVWKIWNVYIFHLFNYIYI
jgi:hypothetical protein